MAVLSQVGPLAGRTGEQRLLRTALEAAAGGTPSASLIHGEAGVGKTRLARALCDEARRRGFTVLWGRCVRLGAVEASYHPLVRALHEWARDADPAARALVFDGASTVEELATGAEIDGVERSGGSGLFAAIDSAIDALAELGPTVLVLDDLQWADHASRDALAYLIAGFHRQQLAVLATYRDEDLGVGHSLHGWLADARRLPAVVEIELARLSDGETEEQLAQLLGRAPAPTLVDEVMTRSNGNAYLNELLVQDLDPDAEHLSDRVSAALSDALLARWHLLPGSAREVLRVLAVAGRPATSIRLANVTRQCGIPAAECSTALHDAIERGIVVPLGGDVHWFRHPLIAELLYAAYPSTEAAPVHAAWAQEIGRQTRVGVDELERQADLALHHERSGNDPESLEASLRAAELAEQIGAVREVAEHLERASRLWPGVFDGEDERRGEIELLERSARASRRVGDGKESLAALTRALALVDVERDPLTASRIMVYHASTTWFVEAHDGEPLAELAHAVALSESEPDSREHAEALAELGASEAWAGMAGSARRHGEEAVAAARRSGSSGTLANALIVRAYANGFDGETDDQDTRAALTLSLEGGEPEDVCWAYLARYNALEARGRLVDQVAVMREGYDYARDRDELSMVVQLSSSLCGVLLTMGRLHEAAAVIREGLARSAVPNAGAAVRLEAASLAVRTGHPLVAEQHLRRAEELMPGLAQRPALEAPPTLAEFDLARGDGQQALRMLDETLTAQSIDSRMMDRMVTWAARAAADLTVRARDRQDADAERHARKALEGLIARRSDLGSEPFAAPWPGDLVQPAWQAVFEAEVARGDGVPRAAASWEAAVTACEAAGMRWEAETSRLRWTQALAVEGGTQTAVATQLRSGHRFCVDAGAVALQQEFEDLAQACGVDLTDPSERPEAPSLGPPFNGLTEREREVLSYLVAGRTYAEIAEALFITPKTVSTHVSNLLRKTGTRSRREVAVLFRRGGNRQTLS